MKLSDLVPIKDGPKGAVKLTTDVADAFEGVDARGRARILRTMSYFCDIGSTKLQKEVYRFEERINVGSGNRRKRIPIYAFKGSQVRIYGSVRSINKKRTFVGTEIDASKKQNKANRALLKKAAEKFEALEE